jgi:SAM-dependent methyltransferase
MNCRHCKYPLKHSFLNLGFAPPSNAYLDINDLILTETYFPLKVVVCDECWLVQTEDYANEKELFDHKYAYFSSTSSSFLLHAKEYSENITRRLNLNTESFVIEIASNDGYLLKNFVDKGIPCLGIEPTESTAKVSKKLGIDVIQEFFGSSLANRLIKSNRKADLIVGNNVYAHVPDINDFTKGLKYLLEDTGTITLEFPHLMKLIEHNQFDTIYHEHFSYLSLHTVISIFEKEGLRVFDVDVLPTHGGSIRIYGCHKEDEREIENAVSLLLLEEKKKHMLSLDVYKNFQIRADRVKNDLLKFLVDQYINGKKVIAYGAAAKGNTLLNYAGVKSDLVRFVVDAAHSKQNMFLPGSHIPIVSPENMFQEKFDYVLILPWNISEEIYSQLREVVNPETKFVTAVPELRIF